MKPILFQIGEIAIPSYLLMLSLSFIVGSLLFIYSYRRKNISINKLFGLIISIQVTAILGSRLLFILSNYSQFESDLSMMFSLSPGGFAVNGGLILGLAAGILYIRLNNLPFWDISDFTASPMALGICLTRIGCFLGGCCYGKETHFFTGVRFPDTSLVAQKYGVSHLVHPTQLYESFFGLIVFIVFLIIRKRRKFPGQIFLLFLTLYLLFRILNDIFRGDITHNYIFNLSQTQLIGVILILAAIIAYRIRSTAIPAPQT